MHRYSYYNLNPFKRNVGDCVIRAIAKATGKSWDETYIALMVEGLLLKDMPTANHVWGSYLRQQGFKRYLVPDVENYTVSDFCDEHPDGTFILAISGHVVCVQDGTIYDSWDSSNEVPVYFWVKDGD